MLLAPPPKLTLSNAVIVGRDDAGQDAQQLERAAADDRQVLDLLGAEHAFAGAGLGLDDFDRAGDRDDLGQAADFEPHVDAAGVVRAEREVLARRS